MNSLIDATRYGLTDWEGGRGRYSRDWRRMADATNEEGGCAVSLAIEERSVTILCYVEPPRTWRPTQGEAPPNVCGQDVTFGVSVWRDVHGRPHPADLATWQAMADGLLAAITSSTAWTEMDARLGYARRAGEDALCLHMAAGLGAP